jgi:hypothetical protein
MTLAKYAHLVMTGTLHLARLTEFPDPWEGRFVPTSVPDPELEEMGYTSAILQQMVQERTFASCWHAERSESMAMWDRYAASESAVCVVTTVKRLYESCDPDVDDLLIGKVRYIDFRRPRLTRGEAGVALVKPLPYRYEREVRLYRMDDISEPPSGLIGNAVQVDLTVLLKEVVLAPRAQAWELETVQQLTQAHVANGVRVTRSEILELF